MKHYNVPMHIKQRHVGLAVLGLATVITATLIWMGVTGQKWPEWLLAVTMVL